MACQLAAGTSATLVAARGDETMNSATVTVQIAADDATT